ncbi:hypothetical protein [Litorihabitans aurantiacus]|uniref:Type VI secretion system spike protein VgrG3-like C-terminal domain-containing protein n=1 Tax=Litorihabitans aurantiacus TaxID=1930061 RepID=A0AA37UHM6_9MICO|nr:hypothetical protein [Litorihabitans aurantiacus]GMA30903.1 hypothetical protein GCM10025875_08950 [Litorihabitans aurantiacus]
MTTFSGADVQLLRDLAGAMSTGGDEIDGVRARLGAAVPALAWSGRDQQRFAQDWAGTFDPALAGVVGALRGASQTAQAEAEDQDVASSAGGAGGSGGGGGAGGATTGAAAIGGDVGASSGSSSGATTAAAGTTAASPTTDRYGHPTGDLSARYESRGDVATVSTGRNDPGGISYGTHQLATNRGTPEQFVAWSREHYPAAHEELQGLTPGTPAFADAWRSVAAADAEGFGHAQHDFIAEHHFRPGVDKIAQRLPGFTLEGRDPVIADVVWSSAVQHGPTGAGRIFAEGTAGQDVGAMSDADLVRAVYAERIRRFPNLSPRFRDEQADALAQLGVTP